MRLSLLIRATLYVALSSAFASSMVHAQLVDRTQAATSPPGWKHRTPDLLAASGGGVVTTPSGMVLDGTLDTFSPPPAPNPAADPDGDGVVNEIDTALVDHMEFYLLNYFRPANYEQTAVTEKGRAVFDEIGCAKCHTPAMKLGRDRRVADVDTAFDPVQGIFNQLFSTATPLVNVIPDPPTRPFRFRRSIPSWSTASTAT